MSYKATKKLLEKAIENQKSAPKPIGLSKGAVKVIELVNMSAKLREGIVQRDKVADVIEPVVSEKLRGYKVVQKSPKPIILGSPSRLF